MELKIEDYQLPRQILFNYEELKQELVEKASFYETLVYTDDQIQDARKEKAKLNKLKKAFNDERLRMEREYMQPFNEFKDKINEFIGIIDTSVSAIDRQIKEYEAEKKQKKMEQITELWNSLDVPKGLTLEKVFNERMLNVSFGIRQVQTWFDDAIRKFKRDMDTLANLPEYGFEAQQEYLSSLDMAKAMDEVNKLSKMARMKAEHEAELERREIPADVIPAKEPTESEERQDDTVPADAVSVNADVPRQWVAFQALLSTEEALALRDFFLQKHIEFKAV